ncbi:hypothetical protein DFQ01_1398 [Paenibacillus cellulosilyticus]|uniref:Nucleotidyltransferase-like protein n=1 Tax=Paenibacillus cellulosilyticus TaxID=375489 RepID=A0A2V2YNI9_9BACL|nr:nucleotidyltransferase family protein [Paenibacillus cellulosilyticus]PWV90958.1 hypothetical protein DFQ01_1398 [Paenibacillus cellulosilyticus]QKS45176.1 nucleotidyltransferase family protein [Paenibacillus cellulosilyticus]
MHPALESSLEIRLRQCIECHPGIMRDLRLVQTLGLPDWYIAAGYIRSIVWDELHGYEPGDRHDDIDVIYYEPSDCSEAKEKELEEQLKQKTGNPKWSVKNQARMHIRNGDAPYESAADAMSLWPETATAVGVRLDEADKLHIAAPYGLADLFNVVLRRSPRFENRTYYLQRMRAKQWHQHWPKLQVIED